jgi:hypothetical protein
MNRNKPAFDPDQERTRPGHGIKNRMGVVWSLPCHATPDLFKGFLYDLLSLFILHPV